MSTHKLTFFALKILAIPLLLLGVLVYTKIAEAINGFKLHVRSMFKSNKGSRTGSDRTCIREWVKVGDYEIFVHRLVKQSGAAGEHIVYTEVEYRNQTDKQNLSCRRNQWHLYARDGYSYEAESTVTAGNLYTDKKYFGGERYINPRMNARGWLAFKVPDQAEITTLQFMTEFLRTQTVDIHVENAIEMEGRFSQNPATIY